MFERNQCPRNSDWCDGVICRVHGINCPNADPVAEKTAVGMSENIGILPGGFFARLLRKSCDEHEWGPWEPCGPRFQPAVQARRCCVVCEYEEHR